MADVAVPPSCDNRMVTIDVRGMPRPQGSLKLHRLPGGRTAARYPAGVYVWRGQVQAAVAECIEGLECAQIAGPVDVRLGFDLPRPTGHFGTGKNAGTVKASSPILPAVAPDLDKLCRAILDSCTDAGLWRDDSQVCVLHAAKRYVEPPTVPGVLIKVTPLIADYQPEGT